MDPIILMLMRHFLVSEYNASIQEKILRREQLHLARDTYKICGEYPNKLRAHGCIAHWNRIKQMCASLKRDVQNIEQLIKYEHKQHRLNNYSKRKPVPKMVERSDPWNILDMQGRSKCDKREFTVNMTVINVPVAMMMVQWFGEQREGATIELRNEITRITHCLRQLIAHDTFEFTARRKQLQAE